MTPEQFCYWLQGFSELTPGAPTQAQWHAIRDHLNRVFNKVTDPVVHPIAPAGETEAAPKNQPVSPLKDSDDIARLIEAARKAKDNLPPAHIYPGVPPYPRLPEVWLQPAIGPQWQPSPYVDPLSPRLYC